MRTESYGIFRDVRFTEHAFDQINQILAQGTIDTILIQPEHFASNKTLKEIDLRAKLTQLSFLLFGTINSCQTHRAIS